MLMRLFLLGISAAAGTVQRERQTGTATSTVAAPSAATPTTTTPAPATSITETETSVTISNSYAVTNATSDDMVANAPGLCVGGPMCADYVDPVSCETQTTGGLLRGLRSKQCNWTRSCNGYCTGSHACESLPESKCSNSALGCTWKCAELLGSSWENPWSYVNPAATAAEYAYSYSLCVQRGYTCKWSQEWYGRPCCADTECRWTGGEQRCV